jgi:hypothetical protein
MLLVLSGQCEVVHWHESFEHLKAFKNKHGHCRVPGQKVKDSATSTGFVRKTTMGTLSAFAARQEIANEGGKNPNVE